MKPYDHKEIEPKWQKRWAEEGTYTTSDDAGKEKTYVLDMFPYPSGDGLHVGHPKGYIATDIYARMQRMLGKAVLHPMGWDAFGLPAENYAIKHKVHPRKAVEANVARFKEQLSIIGLDYDWSREINTTDPAYYKWTQWIFLKLLEKGLAYETTAPINWCPSCQTGLANEDVEADGTCERCGTKVEKRPMRQWVLKITDYADRLLDDLATLTCWPEHIKEQQRNWIGRSEGAEIDFELKDSSRKITVFTTRVDTLFGATYLVLAPEHSMIGELLTTSINRSEVEKYIAKAKEKTEIDRTGAKVKTGVELKGVKVINPATKEEIPVWVADYVIGSYGTGAVMAVPAHDDRDHDFATKYHLPMRQVIEPTYTQDVEPGIPKEGMPYEHREVVIAIVKHWSEKKYLALKWKEVAWGTFITGGIEEGQTVETAAIAEIREETGYQHPKFIKDFGVVHGKFYHVPKKVNRNAHAHVVYFELADGERTETDDTEKAIHEVMWLSKDELKKFLTPPTHQHGLRMLMGEQEIWTSDGTLMNSSTFDRLESVEARKKIVAHVGGRMKNHYRIADWVFSRQRYWGEPIPVIHCQRCGTVPVPEKDLPVRLPEVEHYEPTGTGESPLANIAEWVNVPCPKCGGMGKRETNTMPQWAGSSWYWLRFMDPQNDKVLANEKLEKHWGPVDVYVGGDHAVRHLIYARFWHKFLYDIGVVHTEEPFERLEFLGFILAEDGRKMSKRWGNVINPDDVIDRVGADSFRVYEMFMGPFENAIAWSTDGLVGARRFVERVWRLAEKASGSKDGPTEVDIELHKTIQKVTSDIEAFKFNTAISQMMIFINAAEKIGVGKEQFESFLKLLAPFAPHVTEELWAELGNRGSIHVEPWPSFNPAKIIPGSAVVAVQIGGKTRGTVTVPRGSLQDVVVSAAQENPELSKYLDFKPQKVVFVLDKVINFVP